MLALFKTQANVIFSQRRTDIRSLVDNARVNMREQLLVDQRLRAKEILFQDEGPTSQRLK